MNRQEMLYSLSSLEIAAALFVRIVLYIEVGFQTGCFIQRRADAEIKSLTGAVQASILGLLALLLGFTFSISMQRYDNRSHALIDAVNTTGTAVMRTSGAKKNLL